MKLGPELITSINRNLTAWRSKSDPSPGKYVLAMDPIGVPQLVIHDASGRWIWRGGPWNGYTISGFCPKKLLSVGLYKDFNQFFYSTPVEIYYYFNTIVDAIATLTMDTDGVAKLYEWKPTWKKWNLVWLAPIDPCDFFPACGTNSVCDSSSSLMCQCFDGFEPRNPLKWSRGEWSDGCVRVAELGCGVNGTDEFMVVRGTMLPDTREAVADVSLGLDGCRTRCLMNCSCKAYAGVHLSGGGSGCLIWMAEINDLRTSASESPQDIYVRVASRLNNSDGSKRKIWIFVTTTAILLFFLIILILAILVIRKRRSIVSSLNWVDEIMGKLEADMKGSSKISLFQFSQLESATNNFSVTNKLGEGGFGPVYKGELPDGLQIAIKRLSARSGQGFEELKNEILLIAKLQHRNLVRLLGFCIHEEEKMLIYEFMPNKSLDLWLFNVEHGSKLDWMSRFEIIEGIAQGLLYLHKHSRLRVVHRDLKASNILLDADMNPKISDFGMARIFDSDEIQANTRRIVGTYGYMSPEYAFNGLFSFKSDVFSFGVLLLEIVSGKRNASFYEIDSPYNLLSYAWELWKDGTWMELVDPALGNKFRHNDVARCIYVALQCAQESPDDRPFMSDVISMLGNESLYFNHIKQPAFFIMKNASESKWPPKSQVNYSCNGLTLSSITGHSTAIIGNPERMAQLILSPTLFFFLASFSFFSSISSAGDTLSPSHHLSHGETLVSANGTFALGFFTPPNTTNRYIGIWYHNLAVHTVVWVANRRNPIPNLNATLSLTADGASLYLVISGNSNHFWSTPPFPNSISDPIAQLLDTGNFVVKSTSSNSILWQSFDHPTDTLLPGMKFGPNLKTGIDRNLTSWRSPSDPSPGKYTLAMDPIGVPQLVIRDSSGSWIWRGGPWNGFGFSGAGPDHFFDLALYREFSSTFKSTPEEIYYSYSAVDNVISRVNMHQNGTDRRYLWKASSQQWNLEWSAPSDACDFFPACGTNAVCDLKSSPICRCLDGFDPRNSISWSQGDWSDGCVRVGALGCESNGTDEFMVVRASKLPDTTEAIADMSLDLDGCRARCLLNCSCKAYASADLTRGGIGCIIWMAEIKDLRVYVNGGQDLYVRVTPKGKGRSERKLWIFIVTSVAFVLFVLIVLMCVFMTRRRKHKEEQPSISSANYDHKIMHKFEAGREGNSEISLFKFSQIMSATNNFSDKSKLGEGGFGPVYKGKLSDGEEVAIKRLSTTSQQGLEEFKNEILLIAKLQHRNLVRLLGCCIHGEEKMLIYELMPNKSLDLLLFDIEEGFKLYWERRFQIIEGIAEGLLYLHKHSRLRIVHRDLKASNILLDAEMNPKISDFGLARIFDSNDTHQANTRRVVGTFGYMSPEYAFNGLFSVKSDVFSFGVLLLEIVSGKKNAGFHESDSWCNLLAYAWDLWTEGNWIEFVDPALNNNFRHDEVARCIYVALLCVQERSEDRPVMSDVVTMLSSESLCFDSIKQPAYFAMNNASDFVRPLKVNISSNALSFSIIAGR
ncbi:G-type lectin S-receptor-like serine/threonine-protein kinase At4g27290 [Phalaenopsis equestris]|uniref:G-type lectin S-receptor-like serine/threonine-protein kinase At4g27290 n=1 Tax=Phalaenopsis equestris TaxID=78828 RepID=UPI0009E3A2D2|nr:G-type lectin S-receptor-like serine/threonine-protein kinase At4g27290 [Phalaenopsis equestris]